MDPLAGAAALFVVGLAATLVVIVVVDCIARLLVWLVKR